MIRSGKILELDVPLTMMNKITLREWMSNKENKNGCPLFLGMDRVGKWEDPTRIQKSFLVLKKDVKRANALLDTLPALVTKELGQESHKWFTQEGMETIDEVKYKEDGTFTTNDDEMLGHMAKEDFGLKIELDLEALKVGDGEEDEYREDEDDEGDEEEEDDDDEDSESDISNTEAELRRTKRKLRQAQETVHSFKSAAGISDGESTIDS